MRQAKCVLSDVKTGVLAHVFLKLTSNYTFPVLTQWQGHQIKESVKAMSIPDRLVENSMCCSYKIEGTIEERIRFRVRFLLV